MKRFLKEYRIEIITVGIILLGFFLMFERLQIRNTLLMALNNVSNALLSVLRKIIESVSSRLAVITLSDAIGLILILLAGGVILWRVRYRFTTGKQWETDICPKCSNPIMRVHRSTWDHFMSAIFLPDARRYRCMNPDCGWSGLRRRHIHHRRHHSEKVSGAENP